jgi:hypothetical protein
VAFVFSARAHSFAVSSFPAPLRIARATLTLAFTDMAERLNRMHSEQVRQKIQASVLIQRLHGHVMGEVEMNAANSLLDRSVPKLSQIQHVGDDENPVAIKTIERVLVRAKTPDTNG